MTLTTTTLFDRFLNWLALLACGLLLAACGGGGGNPGGTGTNTGTGTPGGGSTSAGSVVVNFVGADGVTAAGNVVTSAAPLTAHALVKDAGGKIVANALVTFTADPNLVLLSPSAGTALTDGNGNATVILRPFTASVSGAGTLTASTVIGTTTVSNTANFTVTSTTTAAPTIALTFVNAAGAPASSVTASSPLTARALVKDPTGKPIVNALVAFATDNTLAVFTPSAGTTLTDATGVASVTLKPASLSASGAAKVTASVTVSGTTVLSEQNYVVGATALSLSALTLTPASIPAYGSTIITLDVLAGATKYTDQQLTVNFTSACVTAGKATLAAKVPTNNGSVQAVYRDQGCGNNDLISAAVDGVSKPATAVLAIAVPAAASIQFETATPTDRSIVIKGQGGITRTETATLKFRVFDTFGNALPGKNVTFSTVSPATDVVINKIHDSTDANGEVITTVNSGSNPNTFRITATIDGSSISTTSDSIVVTTGVLVQRAFSLSVGADNIEGWTYDSGPTTPATTVSLLIADLAGNPVADGTPAVFQTNMGSVGSSSKGACNTVNGGCSVDFRTQDPRVPARNSPATPCNKFGVGGIDTDGSSLDDSTRPGLATICASSTDGSTTIYKKIGLFMSGSTANNVYLYTSGGLVKLGTDPTQPATDLGSVGAYDPKVFNLLISDVNFNPMPYGSKVEITNINNGSAVGVGPSTVANIFAHASGKDYPNGTPVNGVTLDSNQGTTHTVTIGSAQPKPCTGPLVSTFNIAITTPVFGTRGQSVTSYPFKVTFTCP